MNKKVLITVTLSMAVILFLIIAGCNKENKPYGTSISNNSVITIKELQEKKTEYNGKTVKIKGKITDVCQDMGCWFNVNDGTGIMYIDLEMGRNFTIPKNSANQPVIVEGTLKFKDASLSIVGSGVKIGE